MRWRRSDRVFYVTSQPGRQKASEFRRVSAQQTFDVEHTGTLLAQIPRGMQPPVVPDLRLQAKLQHPQQAHGYQQGLRGPLDRRPGPGSAFFPPQTLLQIPTPIFLPETGRE